MSPYRRAPDYMQTLKTLTEIFAQSGRVIWMGVRPTRLSVLRYLQA